MHDIYFEACILLTSLTVCQYFPEIYVRGPNTTLHSNKSANFELYEYILMRENIILPYRLPSDHLHNRVTCTYEVPPSSELESIDPVLGQQIQSSAEVTVHLTLSQTESGPATYDTASDCKKECEHDHLDETNRKSGSVSEGCSDIQERARENTVLVSGEERIEQPPALCDKKDMYVYAVVHKERKGGASSGASTLKKSSDRPQEGTGLLVNRRSCVDGDDRSSHPTDLGLDKNTEAAESETLQAGGNSEYLYAAVEKTKKKKPPQVINFTNPENFLPFYHYYYYYYCYYYYHYCYYYYYHYCYYYYHYCYFSLTSFFCFSAV